MLAPQRINRDTFSFQMACIEYVIKHRFHTSECCVAQELLLWVLIIDLFH